MNKAILSTATLAAATCWVSLVSISHAAPKFWLTGTGGPSTAGSIQQGTSVSLDLHFDSGNFPVGALAYQFSVTDLNMPTSQVSYPLGGGVTALGSPFGAAELSFVPTGEVTLDNPNGITNWFTSPNDYPAFASAIARHAFDTSELPPGQCTFTPVGTELVHDNPAITIETFETPGSFTLTVTSVPEPGTLALIGVGWIGAMRRTRARCRTMCENR